MAIVKQDRRRRQSRVRQFPAQPRRNSIDAGDLSGAEAMDRQALALRRKVDGPATSGSADPLQQPRIHFSREELRLG